MLLFLEIAVPFRLNFTLSNVAPYGNLGFGQKHLKLNKPAQGQNLLCGATLTPKFRALVARIYRRACLKAT
ncbi:hypothetical protein CAMSH0001_0197 [Campylobacter showae RM3277]|uniref:Uncharacterized protein n=1 Tax=Campylobacter showae RM3277 TaxID=553219 RepID=C6RJ96_9BACT|nr:hypothetical protein CAMSH0001_0197 [Campylobacter showae RM3277]